jgi:uncharacterized protein YjdB
MRPASPSRTRRRESAHVGAPSGPRTADLRVPTRARSRVDRHGRRAAPAALALLSLLAAACGGGGDGGGGTSPQVPTVATVRVAPSSATIDQGSTTQLTASALDGSGTVVTGGSATWASSDPAIASVSPAGTVTGVAPGVASVTATISGRTGSAIITVRPAVASVSVSPTTADVTVGAAPVRLTAQARDVSGAPIAGVTPTWASADPAIAAVSATGDVTGVSPGVVTVTATVAGRSASATITVLPDIATIAVTPPAAEITVGGTSLQLAAEPRSSTGDPVTGRTVTWSSSTPAVATVSANGLVTAVAPGSATISASIGDVTGSAAITVRPDPCSVLRTVQLGATVNGRLEQSDCRLDDNTAIQFFEFTLTTETAVEILMNSTEVDPYLFLADPSLNVIDQDDDGGDGLNARILRTLPAGRWIVVTNTFAAGTFGSYELVVRQAPLACTQAAPVTLPATVNGALGSASCRQRDASFENRYAFTVSDTTTLRLSMRSTQVDPFLVVLDAAAQVVAQDDDSGEGNDAEIEVEFSPGVYTVLTRGAADQTGAYALVIEPAADPCAVTQSITVGQTLQRTFAPGDCSVSDGGGPVRFFQRFLLEVTSQQALQLDMTSTAVDAYLILQNAADGAVLAENDDVEQGNTNARLAGTFAPGTFIVNATTFRTGETGPFQLSLTPLQQTNVTVTVTPATVQLQAGQTQALTATVTGSGNTAVTWRSSDANVASVDANGVVRGVTAGTATVTATSQADPSRSASATITVSAGGGSNVNLDVAAAYLVQAVQQPDGRIPMVAGRSALARIFVRGNRTGLDTVDVRLRLFRNGSEIGAFTGRAAPNTTLDESCCSAFIVLPREAIEPGLSFLVDVDPNNVVSESNEGDNQFPLSGTPQPVEVVQTPPFNVQIVPIAQNRNGQVAEASATLFDNIRSIWPISNTQAQVRQPLVIDYIVTSESFEPWIRLVRDVEIVRQAERASDYYYGIVRTVEQRGVLGLANGIPARTATGIDEGSGMGATFSRETFTHEIGHTFGLRHAPCGGAAGPDPNYPFPDGRTGAWGANIPAGRISPPDVFDIMSYCPPNQWVSAYNYRKVLDFRQANPNGAGIRAAATDVLLVSGGIAGGSITVDPAFSLTAHPAARDAGGSHVIEVYDDAGKVIVRWPFSPYRVSDAETPTEAFVVAVPLSPADQARVARIAVRAVDGAASASRVRSLPASETAFSQGAIRAIRRAGRGVEASWSTTQVPAVMVRDRTTGTVLAILREGATSLTDLGAPGDLELLVSDGVKSERLRIDPADGSLRR